MYSVVLMVSLTTAPEIPDHHRRGRRGGHGYSGCYGGGYGYGCCGGGYGGGYGCYGGGYGGCYGGGYGGGMSYGCCGSVVTTTPQTTPEVTPEPSNGDTEKKGDADMEKKGVRGPTPARLLVQLPADARLTIDGEATTSTSAVRVFNTPPLQPGRSYHYDLTAETNRNGVPVRTTQRVQVRAGQQSRVVFTLPTTSTGTSLVRR
jgi:uncharacterized protein (TIGR03000 family)